MRRLRELTLFSNLDSVRLARRFPRTALNLLRDCVTGRAPASFPRRIGLFLTNRCDFACPMCAVRGAREEGLARGGDMPFEVAERVIEEAAAHQPVLDFIGGEPLLYPRLQEAIELARKRRVPCVVTTNGHKLKARVRELARAPILQISLDGWDSASQAARGGVGDSFERLCDGVRAVREARGARRFPVVRILTAITRENYAHLDRIQQVVAGLGIRYWGITNYFYLNREAGARHRAWARGGSATAHAIADDVYLTPEQVRGLRASLGRVRELNRALRLKIAYAWGIDLDRYYSPVEPASDCSCELPYTRLDVQTDGRMSVCVCGETVGQVGRQSIGEVWRGSRMRGYREWYELTKPLPMCFRCCGLSQSIRF